MSDRNVLTLLETTKNQRDRLANDIAHFVRSGHSFLAKESVRKWDLADELYRQLLDEVCKDLLGPLVVT